MSGVGRRIALLGAVVALASCASPSKPGDPGRFAGNSYENSEFGFRVVLPVGWVFVTPETLDAALKPFVEKDAQTASQKAALARTRTLFGMVDVGHPPQPHASARALSALLESSPPSTIGVTAETYAAALRMQLATNSSITLQPEPSHHATLAGSDFVVLPQVIEMSGTRGHQDYYIRVANGRALVLIFVYPDVEQLPREALDAIHTYP